MRGRPSVSRSPAAGGAVSPGESRPERAVVHSGIVTRKLTAIAASRMPMIVSPQRHPRPEVTTAVIRRGPSIAPTPYEAWSQLTRRGEKRAAANALMPASIAPAPSPASRPAPTMTHQAGATA